MTIKGSDPPKNTSLISLVLPSYNERDNLIPLIHAIHRDLGDRPHEIIIVDDNSPDGTYKAVLDLELPFVRAILRVKDRGLANSIRCGLEIAKGGAYIVMDSDFNHRPEYLPFMVDALQYYDCVTASRFLYGGRMDSRWRHIFSWLFNIFTRLVTGGYITDNLYGYFAVRKTAMETLSYNRIFWGYGDYFIRLLYYLQKNRVNILQFPAVNGKRLMGKGNSNMVRIFWQYFREVVKLAFRGRLQNV